MSRAKLNGQRPVTIAWMGGSSPEPLLSISAAERSIVSFLFQEQVVEWTSYWQDKIPLDLCRIFWNRARGDAHATHRKRSQW